MPEPLNPSAVDAAISSTTTTPDLVSLPANEIMRLRELERGYADLEATSARTVLDRDIAAALANHPILSGTSGQLARLWQNDFEVKRVDGKFVVLGKEGGSVEEVVRARLLSPEYSHFIKSAHRGGSGGGTNGDATRAAAQDGKAAELTYVQKIAANLEAGRQAHGARGIGGNTRS